ncbi:MAG: type II toxin-antitoxin system Phd/YefM family antitoxin [Blastocatellia bacterium]
MQLIDVLEAQLTLPRLLEATCRGEEIVITDKRQPVAKLVPFTEAEGDLRYGSAKGLVAITENFDAPLEDHGLS